MKSSRFGARLAVVSVLVVTAAFIPIRARALDDYTSPRNAQVDTRGATSVRIEAAAGFLKVEGRKDIDQVRVQGTAHASRRNWLDDIKLIAERRGDQVYIKADIPDQNFGAWRGDADLALDLTIEVPISLRLDVDDGSGDAEFTNTGALSFNDGSGEMTIRGVHGNLKVIDGSGGITIDGVEGSVRVDDGSGDIRARNITGDFTIGNDGSGDINVSSVGGTMRVESDGSGGIEVDRIAGDFVVEHDGSGDIEYQSVKGSVRIPERKRRG